MPKVSLSGMTVEALMDLRTRVDGMLHQHRAEIEKRLERMDRAIAEAGSRGGQRGSALKEGKSRRNIEVRQAKLGQVVARNLVGSLLRLKVERNSTIS